MAIINDAVRYLPLRKAPGHDGMQNEHIIHAGSQLLVHLSLLFTGMLRHSYVPQDFRLKSSDTWCELRFCYGINK